MDKALIDRILEVLPLLVSLFFTILFLVKRKKQQVSNTLLSFFFFCFVLIHVFYAFSSHLIGPQKIFLIIPFVCATVALPPTIYFYTNSITINVSKINYLKGYALAITSLPLNIISLSLLIYFGADEELKSVFLSIAYFTALTPIALFPVLSIYYIYKSFKLIRKHQQNIGDIYSYEEGINLNWIKYFLAGFVAFFIFAMLDYLVTNQFNNKFLEEIAFNVIAFSYVSFIGVKALQQSIINSALKKAKSLIIDEEKENESVSDEEELEDQKYIEIKHRLEEYMTLKKPFTDTTLSIYDLAKKIDTNYKYLSKTINICFNQNFVSYINSYRVEEAMVLLKDGTYDNYTIEALAEMSGFKSKSAFNTAFKKHVGKTPSEFKKS